MDNDATNLGSMSWHFRTIGMGSINYRLAAKRLAREVDSVGLFASSIGESESFLKHQCGDFWKKHSKVLKPYVPGFGWWVWKAEYVRTSLKLIPEGDGLLYMDAGSYMSRDPKDIAELRNLIAAASTVDFIGSNSQNFVESSYSSEDLLHLLGLSGSDRVSNQFYGGFLLVKNNSHGRALVNTWVELTCQQNHRFLYPLEFVSENNPNFIHHAYDQAILSGLLKKNNSLSVYVGDKNQPGVIRLRRHKLACSYDESNKAAVQFFTTVQFLSRLKNALQRRLRRKTWRQPPIPHG
jgi:hypothetical protein